MFLPTCIIVNNEQYKTTCLNSTSQLVTLTNNFIMLFLTLGKQYDQLTNQSFSFVVKTTIQLTPGLKTTHYNDSY